MIELKAIWYDRENNRFTKDEPEELTKNWLKIYAIQPTEKLYMSETYMTDDGGKVEFTYAEKDFNFSTYAKAEICRHEELGLTENDMVEAGVPAEFFVELIQYVI